MGRKRFLLTLVVVLFGAMAGGFLAVCVTQGRGSAAHAQAEPEATNLVVTKALQIVDPEGNIRADLSTEADGSVGLELYDTEGRMRMVFAVADEQYPFIAMYSEDDVERVLLRCAQDMPYLLMTDENEEPSVEVAHFTNGPGVVLSHGEGDHRVTLGADVNGWSNVSLYDENAERISLDVDTDGTPGITIGNEDGEAIWSAP